MKELYLLSGLGADKRIFELLNLTGNKVTYVEWIMPFKNESIEDYARRLLKQIPTTKPTLIGVSFGGMMSIEIGKLIETEKIILISSVRTKSQIPFSYKLAGKLGLLKIMSASALKKVTPLTYRSFGTTTKEEKQLLQTFIKEIDITTLRWSLDKILNWKNETPLNNVIQIHGTHDRIFPLRKSDFIIKDGGHWMVRDKAEELTVLLRKLLG